MPDHHRGTHYPDGISMPSSLCNGLDISRREKKMPTNISGRARGVSWSDAEATADDNVYWKNPLPSPPQGTIGTKCQISKCYFIMS